MDELNGPFAETINGPLLCSTQESCWICHEETELADLIHPCSCIGTVGAVHRTCLTSWVRNSGNFRCMQCRDTYVLAPDADAAEWNKNWAIAKCAAMFAAESAAFLALVHVPIAVITPIAYATATSAADNVQTRLASALLTAYGGELLVMLLVAIVVCIAGCIKAHERHCDCCSCRCGNRSLITDLYLISIFSSNSRSSGGGGEDCNCSGGSSGSSGGSGDCDGESIAGIPIAIAILLLLSVILFYAVCLGVIMYIAHRHVTKYYARRKMDAFVIQSIR